MPLGSNLDEFDVIGGSDLFRGAQGYQDDRYEIMHILTVRLWEFLYCQNHFTKITLNSSFILRKKKLSKKVEI